ncbi:MAG TPA: DUF1810 domain-containing protein [Rhizomicrobium sp.]|nr:DUF1810 domain-containing protein [Rhizomicrobium sp.]
MDYDLDRFLAAQEPVYKRAMEELRHGQKRSHWMWFVFPQIAGLGRSDMAQRYAIVSLEEAREYLAHPVLGLRLREFTALVMAIEGKTIHEIFGTPDDLKFHSCMTLFRHAAGEDDTLFASAIDRFFDGKDDKHTLARI